MALVQSRIATRIYWRSGSGSILLATTRKVLSGNQNQSQQCQHQYSTTTNSTSSSSSDTTANIHGQINRDPVDPYDCPELPSTPSWSLKSIMEYRDQIPPACPTLPPKDPSRDPITPETINQLIKLAHLRPPSNEKVLHRLQRDVIRMRNFLDYIRDHDLERPHVTSGVKDGQAQAKVIVNLRSLVDDGKGLQMRTSRGADMYNDDGVDESDEQAKLKRRDMLLRRPKKVRGNFFVVATRPDTSAS